MKRHVSLLVYAAFFVVPALAEINNTPLEEYTCTAVTNQNGTCSVTAETCHNLNPICTPQNNPFNPTGAACSCVAGAYCRGTCSRDPEVGPWMPGQYKIYQDDTCGPEGFCYFNSSHPAEPNENYGGCAATTEGMLYEGTCRTNNPIQ